MTFIINIQRQRLHKLNCLLFSTLLPMFVFLMEFNVLDKTNIHTHKFAYNVSLFPVTSHKSNIFREGKKTDFIAILSQPQNYLHTRFFFTDGPHKSYVHFIS